MIALERLGFSKYRKLPRDFAKAFQDKTGYRLPQDYLDFLEYRQPSDIALMYRFRRANGEEWEGQVDEFLFTKPRADDLEGVAREILKPEALGGRALLRIARDAGGNELYILLSEPGMPVVDVDYSTGALSYVAPSFGDFVGTLEQLEE